VRIRTGAEGLNETDTTPEGANMNDDLAHTHSMTGSAFAIANNSWSFLHGLEKLMQKRRKPGGLFVELERNECHISTTTKKILKFSINLVYKYLHSKNLFSYAKKDYYVVDTWCFINH